MKRNFPVTIMMLVMGSIRLLAPLELSAQEKEKPVPDVNGLQASISKMTLPPQACPGKAPKLTAFQEFLTGAGAGVINNLLIYPIITVKNHLQVGQRPPFGPALYRGLTSKLMDQGPTKAIMFGVNGALVNYFTDESGNITQGQRLLAGTTAGVASAIPNSFFELVMVRQQLQAKLKDNGVKPTFFFVVKDIWNHEGTKGLTRGMTANIIREGIYAPSMLVLPPLVQHHLLPEQFNRDYPTISKITSLALSGMTAGLANQWVDTSKTRIQKDTEGHYRGLVDTVGKIYKEEGLRALYKGTVPRMGIIAIGGAVMMNAKRIISDALLFYNVGQRDDSTSDRQ